MAKELKKLRLGVVGMSEGNGHPYSWSAIFNGYDKTEMEKCPFPVIPKYLNKEQFPNNFLTELAEVNHIWTQDTYVSEKVARAANIPFVCDQKEEMIGNVDAILLARDDAENHYEHAKPFLRSGMPLYIDKPFALSIKDADQLWNACKTENQIFSCSALQFAKEFSPEAVDYERLGEIYAVWANIPKSWNKYAVHIIEPSLNLIPNRGEPKQIKSLPIQNENIKGVQVAYTSGLIAQFQTTGTLPSPLTIKILGEKGSQELFFEDTFYAFRSALKRFIHLVNGEKPNIPRNATREMVQILEVLSHA